MDAEHWLVGPQLIGLIFFTIGYISKRFPPKNINHLYGYRTSSSMKSQERWDAANKYSALLMMKLGGILIICGVALSVTLGLLDIPDNTRIATSAIVLTVASVFSCVILLVFTERYLSKTFKDN